MSEFFKPWRRKIGVAMLVMACVFAAGWLRSRTTLDIVELPYSDDTVIVLTSAYSLLSMSDHWKGESKPPSWEAREVFDGLPNGEEDPEEKKERWRYFGFGAGRYLDGSVMPSVNSYCTVPYWALALPLTLLSAWLLLSKPRPEKPKAEPASKTGEAHA